MDLSKYLNKRKTKIVIFKSRNKKITKNLNFVVSEQKITPTDPTK